jgi:Mg2+ and Co2+ transporter CorA
LPPVYRNEIVGLNLVVSTGSLALGWAAALGGVFGMNLINARLADQGWVLAVVLAAMVVISAALLLAVALYARRRKLLSIPDRL